MRVSTPAVLLLLNVFVLASQPALAADPTVAATTPAPPPKQAKVVDDDAVVCKSFAQTGTRFEKRVCLTKAQWAYEHTSAMDALRNNHPLDRMQH
jgi:hypothetical protein